MYGPLAPATSSGGALPSGPSQSPAPQWASGARNLARNPTGVAGRQRAPAQSGGAAVPGAEGRPSRRQLPAWREGGGGT
ncbi:hypothetical protein E2562_019682 [Oryza meyeriana var. granulata]|uniref:Uncharacterized protein n=1 Tax=Oryza meyeriana var. granulata TaxID=110450 RepID=A0A6G1C9B8_9ORYZ|nr:hypothetical protein E2562_019682 [Oryza meyeriana var. granulata]